MTVQGNPRHTKLCRSLHLPTVLQLLARRSNIKQKPDDSMHNRLQRVAPQT
jgi:hypothetical protein